MLDKKQKLFHFFLVVALLLATLGPVVASGRLFQVGRNPNLTQAAGQSLAPAALTDQAGQATSLSDARDGGSVSTETLLEFIAVSWNSSVFEAPPLLAVSWNSGVSEPSELLAVSWNSGIGVDVSWNS